MSQNVQNPQVQSVPMAPNVLLIDAAYADGVTAALSGHFSKALDRSLPKADLAQWLVCLSLDAEMEGGDVQCIFIHDREQKVLDMFAPRNFSQEIDGKAFSEEGLGEFSLACCPVERVTTLTDLCVESLEALLDDKNVKRIAVVYDFDGTTAESRTLTKRITRLCAKHAETEKPKDLTLFTMNPLEDCTTPQQVLGFSILAAMGVRSEELAC